MRHLSERVKSEDGAVAIIAAITLTMLLLFSAFVIDLGALRADRAEAQLVSDMAATAAIQVHEPEEPEGSYRSCLEALAFAEGNLGLTLTSVDEVPDCSVFKTGFPLGDVCDAEVPLEATYVGGQYTVTIVNPVLDPPADNTGLMGGVFYGTGSDGRPCDRIGVRVDRDRDFLIAGAVGLASQGSTAAGALAALTEPDDPEIASLVVLEPVGCGTLAAAGTSTIFVSDAEFTDDEGQTQVFEGAIAVDTEDNPAQNPCQQPNRRVFEPGPSQGGGTSVQIQATKIRSYGLRVGGARIPPRTAQRIDPFPSAGPPITRTLIDHRYNCLETYDDGPLWSPESFPKLDGWEYDCDKQFYEEIEKFDAFSQSPYIENLTDVLGSLDVVSAAAAAFGVFPDDLIGEGAACDPKGQDENDFLLGPGAPGAADASRWFINCPGESFNPDDMRFQDVDLIVVSGDIEISGSDSRLAVTNPRNDPPVVDGRRGTILYLQDGDFERGSAQARIELRDTFVYVHDGVVDIGAGPSETGPLVWESMLLSDADNCATVAVGLDSVPSAACFAPLALWSNAESGHDIGGGSATDVRGTFFIPNAITTLSGGGTLDFRDAQFFVGLLRTSGNPNVLLAPDPRSNLENFPEPPKRLIR